MGCSKNSLWPRDIPPSGSRLWIWLALAFLEAGPPFEFGASNCGNGRVRATADQHAIRNRSSPLLAGDVLRYCRELFHYRNPKASEYLAEHLPPSCNRRRAILAAFYVL